MSGKHHSNRQLKAVKLWALGGLFALQWSCVRKAPPPASAKSAMGTASAAAPATPGVSTDHALQGYESDPRNRTDYSYEEAWEQREHCRTQCCH